MKIALISDIHYGALSTTTDFAIEGEPLKIGSIQNEKSLYQGLVDVLREEQPDYLFVAGDITSSGSPLEFKYCQQKILELGQGSNIKEENIIYCLGNHDIDWRITKLVDEYKSNPDINYSHEDMTYINENYNKLAYSWPKSENMISQYYSDEYELPLTGAIEKDDCIVFVLNSGHLCTNDQKYKHGCLSASQFDWFKNTIKKYEQSDKAKFVLLHHHPCNYPYPITGLDISMLEEGGELIQLCGESGIDLILHGHRHHPKAITKYETNWKRHVTYVCSGSLSVNASHRLHGSIPNMFHIIEYERYDKIVLKNYLYSPATGWSLIKENCPETPVDGVMFLGKVVTDEVAINLLKNLPKNESIKYRSLSDELRYISLNKLNELVGEIHGSDSVVHGFFPEDVFIFKPKGGEEHAKD